MVRMAMSALARAVRAHRHCAQTASKRLLSASPALLPRPNYAPAAFQTVRRSFSSAPPAVDNRPPVKMPLRVYKTEGKWATALYISAIECNELNKVESDLTELIEEMKIDPEFRIYVKHPLRTRDESVKVLSELSDEVGFSEVTKEFLVTLVQKGKINLLEKIASTFFRVMKAHKGEVDVTVRSVIPLPGDEKKDLIDTLNSIAGPGKTVKIHEKVDPSILGGLVIEFEDKIYDVSVKRRVQEMTKLLSESFELGEL